MNRNNKILSLLLAGAMTLSLSLPALAAEDTPAATAPTATASPTPEASTAPTPEASTLPETSGAPVESPAPDASTDPEAPKPVYTDLPEKGWYLEAVAYAVENGIMAGVTADTFAPLENATRGQVFAALYNMAGKPEVTAKTTFTDVEGKDYAVAAAWAESIKLTTGTGKGLFSGEKSITRQEIAKTLSDFMGLQNMTKLQASLSKVTDADAVAAWAKEGMEYAVGAGLIKGTKGAVNPTGTTTRAELAQLLMNFSQLTPTAAADADIAAVEGKITTIEKYGNIGLDLLSVNLYAAGYRAGDLLTVTVGDQALTVPFCTNYSDVNSGELVLRDPAASSSPYVIIAINMGDFAKTYGCQMGDTVTISLKEAAGYLAEYQAHQVTRTNDRADYTSDEVFANFRPIVMGDIAEGTLYRTSSPVNNELGRAAYADRLIEAAGVKTVINLADAAEDIATYTAAEGFASPYYQGLYEADQVVTLNMGVDTSSEVFQGKLKVGLEFMLAHEGPYAFHCTEGKDRAGFMAILLESLMGAKREEIVADYMLSYVNYYHVEKDTEQYKTIAAIADGILCQMAGLEKGSDLSQVDLEKAATDYLTGIGMTKDQISALEKILSTPASAETANTTETDKAA